MDTNRDSAHQSQNEDNFATFSLGLEFLNEPEKEKNNGNFASYFTYHEQSLLTLLSVFRDGFDAQFHRLHVCTNQLLISGCCIIDSNNLLSVTEIGNKSVLSNASNTAILQFFNQNLMIDGVKCFGKIKEYTTGIKLWSSIAF